MCVTTEIPALQGEWKKLRDKNKAAQPDLRAEGNQRLPNEKRNIEYMSRLDAMQAALAEHLKQMFVLHPKDRAMLITFNDEVTILGDGIMSSITIAGDKLESEEELKKEISKLNLLDVKTITESNSMISTKVRELQENGATALGPALLVAIMLCEQWPHRYLR